LTGGRVKFAVAATSALNKLYPALYIVAARGAKQLGRLKKTLAILEQGMFVGYI
jgi:hypothetical protein